MSILYVLVVDEAMPSPGGEGRPLSTFWSFFAAIGVGAHYWPSKSSRATSRR